MMASPTSKNPQAMTTEAMKHTVLTGPAILVKSSRTNNQISTVYQFRQKYENRSRAEHCVET